VFLPGYDDIMDLHDKIREDKTFNPPGYNHRIFLLHSNMQVHTVEISPDTKHIIQYLIFILIKPLYDCSQTNDQRQVFKPLPPSERKIILSTNIAETSITIDDVVFVIDAGKVKEVRMNI
jgi:HrpA-like RNA helicase